METETLPSAGIISRVGESLRSPLPRAHEDLETYIIALEALRFDLVKESVDSMRVLYEKRKQMLWPKDAEKGLTELDRTTRLNGDVAILERDHQFLIKLETLVRERLNLALILLT